MTEDWGDLVRHSFPHVAHLMFALKGLAELHQQAPLKPTDMQTAVSAASNVLHEQLQSADPRPTVIELVGHPFRTLLSQVGIASGILLGGILAGIGKDIGEHAGLFTLLAEKLRHLANAIQSLLQ